MVKKPTRARPLDTLVHGKALAHGKGKESRPNYRAPKFKGTGQ